MHRIGRAAWAMRLALVLVSFSLLGTLGAGCATAVAAEDVEAPRVVATVVVAAQRVVETRSVGGTLEAEHRALLAPLVGGRVEALLVSVGEHVEANQPLLRLRTGELRDALLASHASLAEAHARTGDASAPSPARTAAEARVALAEAALVRANALIDARAVTPEDLERARTELALARSEQEAATRAERADRATLRGAAARVSQDRRALDEAIVRAPFAGRVVSRSVDLGQVIAAGTTVLELVDEAPRRVRFEVPESLVTQVALDTEVQAIATAAPDARFAGRVIEVAPALDPLRRTRTTLALLALDPRLLPGGFATVELPLGERTLVSVPRAAILERGGVSRVFVVVDGHAEERLLEVARREADAVFVARGVLHGEQLVLDPGSLRDGDAVVLGGAS
jgi:RND family efflux transporter MFP subunit